MAFFTIKLVVPVQSPVWPVCPGPRSSISLCFCIIWKFFVQLELMVFPHHCPRPANTAVAKQLFQCCSVVGFGWVFFWKVALWGFSHDYREFFLMFTCYVTSCLHRYLKQGFHLLPLRSESMTAIVPLHFTRNDHTQSFGVTCAQLLLMVPTRDFDVQLTPACRYSRKYPQDTCPRVSCRFFLGVCDLHFL